MKVLVYSARTYDQTALLSASNHEHEFVFTHERLTMNTACLANGYEAISLFTSDDGSANVLHELHKLGVKFISLRSVGHDHIDLATAATLGICVANVPGYSPYAVAEHAVALLMALNRKLIVSQQLISLQDFRIDGLEGFDIHGKTVGILGTGKIGMAFANIMLGFGARVLAFDVAQNEQAINKGVQYVSMDDLFVKSDMISIHCPLNENTKHLIDASRLQNTKTGCIIINTSRGAIIDTKALIQALADGIIGGACLDVYEYEKGLYFEDHRNKIIHDELLAQLRSFPNILITAHQGFLTNEAITKIAATTINNLSCWQREQPCKNELTIRS
jgi:D-lactate dehydrogenase